MATREEQLKAQRQAMERQRFGMTKDEILQKKGMNCAICGQPVPYNDVVIDHKNGGGRHATEMGMIIPGKTHNIDNLQVCHGSCAGKKDRIRGSMGMGMPGNPNNPAQ
jgi:5-methylcytosine-specific restriction endonuclease McrA